MLPEPDFQTLEHRLIRAGLAPRHVRRTVQELREHYDDIVAAEVNAGAAVDQARDQASVELGSLDAVVVAMKSRPELRSWAFRYPRTALLIYPLTCLALLPVVPVFAGIAHAPQIARWGFCVMTGALVTAGMFLLLQLSILLT